MAKARDKHLPICKTALDLAVYLEQVVRNFSRYHKYTLGSDLRQQSRKIITLIVVLSADMEGAPRSLSHPLIRGSHPLTSSLTICSWSVIGRRKRRPQIYSNQGREAVLAADK
ncbi:MAG: hypothetical protein NNA21_09535 [Nitrospira sp.]|nr:hypothetical protein [Nitrospira sp.]MCP9461678.1 hypothetical protein [Nitrospira sp.]MCP9473706.1 hypothetical protein [Nitrospira sp.]